MDLSLDHAEISAVAGSAGRDHTSPQLLITSGNTFRREEKLEAHLTLAQEQVIRCGVL
jgi:hypothetical protein